MVSDRQLPGTDAAEAPKRRLVVLGASNVTRSLATAICTARHLWNEPVDLMIAAGHGRSYGSTSNLLGRKLPGILQCRLWDELGARPPRDTYAVITDLGNDIVYGFEPPLIAQWLEACLKRLSGCKRLVITELPLETVSQLGPGRFLLLRTLSYPSSRIRLRVALEKAAALNEHVKELAARYNAVVVRPSKDWFGLDPIHIRACNWTRAWQKISAPLADEQPAPVAPPYWHQRLRLMRLRPYERRIWGIKQHQAQPVRVFADGSRISLY